MELADKINEQKQNMSFKKKTNKYFHPVVVICKFGSTDIETAVVWEYKINSMKCFDTFL